MRIRDKEKCERKEDRCQVPSVNFPLARVRVNSKIIPSLATKSTLTAFFETGHLSPSCVVTLNDRRVNEIHRIL